MRYKRIISLIVLPWIVFGALSLCKLWDAGINICISFAIQALYLGILYLIDVLFCYYELEPDKALERAKKVIG